MKIKLKWFEYFIIFTFAIGMSVLRYYFVGTISYLFDLIQYIILPVVYGSITRKTNVVANILFTLIMYFGHCGVMAFNMTLCDLLQIQHSSNFVAYILCYIEVYLFVIAFSIFIINGGFKNDKSIVSIK
jgi:hypothetical protein